MKNTLGICGTSDQVFHISQIKSLKTQLYPFDLSDQQNIIVSCTNKSK